MKAHIIILVVWVCMAALIAVGIDAIVKAPVGCDSAALSALYHYLPDAQRFDTEEDYVADRLRLKVLRSWVNTLRDKDIRKRYTCWIDYYSDDLQQKETEAATQARADAAGAALPHPPMETFAALMQR